MIEFIREKSTILVSSLIYSANQPIIVTYRDDSVDQLKINFVKGGIYTAFKDADGFFVFDLTDYVRSQFKHKVTELDNRFITNDAVAVTVDFPMLYNNNIMLYQPVTFVNSLVENELEYNSTIKNCFLTDFDSITNYTDWNEYETNTDKKQHLYFKNTGAIYEYDGLKWYKIATPDGKVLGVKYSTLNKRVGIGFTELENVSLGDDVLYTEFNDVSGALQVIDYEFELNGKPATPAIIQFQGEDPFAPDDYGFINLLPKGTKSFDTSFGNNYVIIWEDWDGIKQRIDNHSSLTYNADKEVMVSYLTVSNDSEGTVIDNKAQIINVVHSTEEATYLVRWQNQYGGFSYYNFDKIVCNSSIDNKTSITIWRDGILSNGTLEVSKDINYTTLLKSRTELMPTFKELSFLPYSTTIQRWSNKGWENITIDEFERSYRIIDKAGSVEFEVINNKQYGLSYVG